MRLILVLVIWLTIPGTALGFQAKIVHEPTVHPGNVFNATRAAELVDGYVLQPGQVFSFNGVVGPRTAQNGFVYGESVIGGQFRPDMGGGVCRTSTVLYQAALAAGFPILERHPHSRPVPYADQTRDSAVWWGKQDLRFRNNMGVPVTIRTKTYGDTLEVRFEIGDTNVLLGGEPIARGWVESGAAMVFLRPVAEALGAKVKFENGQVWLNGNPVEARIVDGRAAVPIRAVGEFLGIDVSWTVGAVVITPVASSSIPESIPV